MTDDFNRHVVITGAAGGIGEALARAYAKKGCRLTLVGRRIEPLQALADALPQAIAVAADVCDEQALAALFAQANARYGAADIVIANAGAAQSAPFGKIDSAHWANMLAVNLTGVFLTFQAALPAMLQQRWGRLIAIASTAGLKGYPYVAAYCAAKHGVIGLTRALASEIAGTGVTVNALCPGFTDTPLLDESIANIVTKTGRSADEARASLASANPMKRLIQPDEVAAAALWLSGTGSDAISGQSISISGGETW